MLVGSYEYNIDASGAGHTPEKQEGNVHGYEQEAMMEKGEVSTKDGSRDVEDGNHTIYNEKKIYVTVFDVQDGVITDSEKQSTPIKIEILNYNSAMPNKISASSLDLKVTAYYNKKESFRLQPFHFKVEENKTKIV